MRTPWLLLSLLLPSLTLTAPPPVDAQSRPAVDRETVVIGIRGLPANLSPLFSRSSEVRTAIFTIDVEWGPDWKPFAQGVESLPNLKDGTWKVDGERMTLLWKIRSRNWHDGRPVTCGDYVFGHTVARNEQVPVVERVLPPGGLAYSGPDYTRRIASVTCPEDESGRQIAVTWKERYPFASIMITEYGASPRHVLESSYRRNPGRLDQTPYGTDPAATFGDGPYRLVEWRRGESVTVESVRDHPIFGTPKIKRIIWREFRDPQKMIAAMMDGIIDAISSGAWSVDETEFQPGPSISIDQAVDLERQAKGRVNVAFAPGFDWEHIDFNLDNPLLGDVRVRRAIAHGINRTQIIQQFFHGKQQVSHSFWPPQHPAYTEAVPRYPYDPARARTLLKDAGFSPGPDGVMQKADGQRLALEFLNPFAGDPVRGRVQQSIQQQLRQIGIDLTIVNFPLRTAFTRMSRRQFAMAMYPWLRLPTSLCAGGYGSGSIPSEANGWRGLNYPGLRSADMDRVCEGAGREVDEARRKILLNEAAKIFARDLPALPLYMNAIASAAKSDLRNYNRGMVADVWNAHTWHWR